MISKAWHLTLKYFWQITLVLIVIMGGFLRIYNIENTYFFEGELGKELLYMRQFSLSHALPIIGMATSHTWLFYGPIYYWVMIPIFNLFNGNPFILFWAALIVSILGLILSFYIVIKLAGRKIAIYLTLIQAISPLLIFITRLSKLHVFFFILSPLFMYALYKMWNGKRHWLFWSGIIFGLTFSFHFSQIPLLGTVVLLFWIKKNIYKWTDWIKFGVGVLIPNLTLIWQDRNLALWLPYRTLSLADKNPQGTLSSFIEYLGRNIFWNHTWWIAGLIIFITVFVHYAWTNRKKFTKDFLPFYLISSIGFMLMANILHGAFPIHYFLPIFTTVPILYSIYLSKNRWGFLILVLIVALNFKGYFAFEKPEGYVPYIKQLEVADFIVANSKDRAFSIHRIGPYDYFPEQYSQNYKYLLLWKGANLIDNSPNVYTIVENDANVYVQK